MYNRKLSGVSKKILKKNLNNIRLLYTLIIIRSGECIHCESYRPLLYKMHLQFDNSPLAKKDQEKNIELCAKLNDFERINAFLNNSNSAARVSIQELEEKIKTLKDALQAKEDITKDLTDRIETLEVLNEYLTKNGNNDPNVSNNKSESTTNSKNTPNENKRIQQPNKCNKGKNQSYKGKFGNNNHNYEAANNKQGPTSNKKDLQICGKNDCVDNDDVGGASGGQSALNQEILKKTKVGNTIMIKNFKSSDLNKDNAIANIIILAEQMGLSLTAAQIRDVFVFRENENFLTYVVEFYTKNMTEAFLGKKHILKNFPQTKFLLVI